MHESAHRAVTEGKIVDAVGNLVSLPASHHTSDNTLSTACSKDVEGRKSNADAERIERIAESEIVKTPTFKEALSVTFSLQCLLLAALYACSFGGELSINSILGAYYNHNFPWLGQTKSGQW